MSFGEHCFGRVAEHQLSQVQPVQRHHAEIACSATGVQNSNRLVAAIGGYHAENLLVYLIIMRNHLPHVLIVTVKIGVVFSAVGVNVGTVKANLGGKMTISVELGNGGSSKVRIVQA